MITEVGVAVGRAVVERAGRAWSKFHEASPLAADVLEGEDAYLVVFDAPGAGHSDVQVRYVDGEGLVRVDRFRAFYEGFEMVFPGRGMALDGRAELPEDARVDAEAATATPTPQGTLEVEVPKVEDSEVANDEDTREEPSEAAENHEEPTDAGGDADEAASDATRDADA
jgi:HSP20 family molecular chaperone IbpA